MDLKSNTDINAEQFVENLITKGARISCDNTNDKFNTPSTNEFDEKKFQRGQQFYHDNIFCLFVGKLLGLITILAIPTILKILMFTNMSGTPLTSYKRYMATIFHMSIWYQKDFKPGSDLWKSIDDVRRRHNNASKRSECCGAHFISQLDMALTQFGFMGYALTHGPKIGLHQDDPEGLRSWVYLWRVIGDLIGIEDQFNICRESVDETRAICRLLIEKQFKPCVEKEDPDFIRMATVLVDGMRVMQPMLNAPASVARVFQLVNADGEVFKRRFQQLTKFEQGRFEFTTFVLETYKHWILRMYHNGVMHISLWLMHYFPFLAIWRFGLKDAYVAILDQDKTTMRELHQSG